jgi:TamB, inner membrane protein subunit of TAM complex
MRRSLGAVLWTLVGILACFLGALSALVGTGTGRKLVARVARTALEGIVAGRVEIGSASGTLLTGIALTDVKLYDLDTTLVAWLPRAELDYNLLDFTAGRIVFQGVRLQQPYVNLVQHQNGRLNFEELLRLGEPGPPRRGPKPLVVLRAVHLLDGELILRLQSKPSRADSLYEIDTYGGDGRRRVRRFDHLSGQIDAFRISAPGQRGMRVDISALATRVSDPPVDLRDASGLVTIDGDSLDADLPLVRLPSSRFSLRGRLRWPRDTILYDLTVGADSVTVADARFIDPRFPDQTTLHGTIGVRSHNGRLLEVKLDPLDLVYHDGQASGRATVMVAADSGLVAVRDVDVVARNLDLTLPSIFLDTLPFYGHLTGRTQADGGLGALALDADWVFRDSLAPGVPENLVRGRGQVDLLAPIGITFGAFTVDTASLDFGSIARLVPTAGLRGTLEAAGTLNGPLQNFRFDGTLRHRDEQRPASVLRGSFAVDSRADTLALDIDARVDTLSFDGLTAQAAHSPVTGTVTGTARLAGRLDSLATHVELARLGGGGAVKADGALVLLPNLIGARSLELNTRQLSLDRWISGAPPSSLNLSVTGGFEVDSTGSSPAGEITAHLAPSRLAGTELDSGGVRARFTDGRMRLDTLWVRQPGLITEGAGDLGWRRPAHGETLIAFDADSLSTLDSMVAWLAGLSSDTARAELTSGAGLFHLRLGGALDSLAVGGLGEVHHLAFGDWRVPNAQLRGQLEPGPTPLVWLDGTADSIASGSLGFGAASGTVRGRSDSLTWSARSRIGDLGGFAAFGRFARDSAHARALGLDSMGVAIPGGVWALERPSVVVIGDSAVTVEHLSLQRVNGPGRFELDGSIPTAGTGNARLHIEGLPLAGVYALLQRDTTGAGGAVQADVSLMGTRRDPVYRGEFAVIPDDSAQGVALDGRVAYLARRLDGDAHLSVSRRQVLALTAHLPIDLALQPVANRQVQDTLAIGATARDVDLSALEALTTALRDLGGHLTADVGIRGTWNNPLLRGSLQIDSGTVSVPALGVRWQDIVGRMRLGGDTIHLDSLTVRSERGVADVSGTVKLERLTHPVLALDIRATDFKALEIRGDLSVTADASLSLRGPVFGATLAGTGTVTNGVLYFADLVEKRIIDLDAPDPSLAPLIDTSLAALIQRQGLGPGFHSLFLDSLNIQGLQLTMGNSVWLRSTEANIQLTGRMTVNKVRRNYLLTGNLQGPRGTYRLKVGPVTREFVVTQGTVRYFGTPDLDAALDIEAQHVVHPVPTPGPKTVEPDITIIAHIGGTLYVPRLTLSAKDRELSQTDIISYLMFGQPSADITGGPAAVSGANRSALLSSTVAGIISGAISGELERSAVSDLGIPLDYVEIRAGDPSNPLVGASFAAGWQIGAKTFFIVRASLCPGSVSNVLGASLQFRISPEWRTEASMEPVAGCTTLKGTSQTQRQVGADLFWEKRY